MGILSWLLGGGVAFAAARAIPIVRPAGWRLELLIAIAASAVGGFFATALDFGGLDEPDPRTILFAALLAFALVAVSRLASLARNTR
jgi:hypothetical protein